MNATLALVFCATTWQEVPEVLAAQPAEDTAASPRAAAAALKDRIRGLRRNLLGGGEMVKEAEGEALNFYRKKNTDFQRRLDGLRADLVAAEAEYHSLLDATLTAGDERRTEALARDARRKSSEVTAMRTKEATWERQRDLARESAVAVQQRIDARERLMDEIDATGDLEETLMLAPGASAFGPGAEEDAGDPFDRQFLLDLAERDPIRARPLVYQRDPELYWQMWPLQPPQHVLRELLRFPMPNLPGQR